VLLGLLLAVPVTVMSAHPAVGRALARAGVCALPEERRAGTHRLRPQRLPAAAGGRPGFPQTARGSRAD
jgi:membrane glycosyltransferase